MKHFIHLLLSFGFFLLLMISQCAGTASAYSIVRPAEGDYYILPERNQNFALDVKGGGQAPAQTPIWLYQKNNSDSQIFTLRHIGSNYYTIAHKRTGLVVNVSWGNTNNDARLWLYQNDNTASCHWRFLNAGNNSYIIQSRLSTAKILDLHDNNPYAGAVVHLWTLHDGQSGRWKLVKIGGATAGNTTNKSTLKGDVNGDGKVDVMGDAVLLNNYVQGKTRSLPRPENADVNGDGKVNIYDVMKIQEIANGRSGTSTNTNTSNNSNTSNSTSSANRLPQGACESYGADVNTLRIAGWAYDPDNMNSKVRVHVYVGGEAGSNTAPSKEFIADRSHNRYNGHGFDAVMNVPNDWCGKRKVNVYALDANKNGAFQRIYTGEFFIPYKGTAVQETPAYTNSALTQRNGSERVDAGDEIMVLEESGNSIRVRYPAGNTTKERWVSKSVFEKANSNAYRSAALQKAKEMVEVTWTAPCDFVAWYGYSAKAYNHVTATDGTRKQYFVKGKTYTGIPYSMANRTFTTDKFLNYLSNNKNTNSYQKIYKNQITTGVGIDCSYFVYIALNASGSSTKLSSSYNTTSTMLSSGLFAKRSSYDSMKPGDIILKPGSHVMLFVGKTSDNRYAVYEADAGDSKCSYNVYSSNYFSSNGYTPYTFRGYGD